MSAKSLVVAAATAVERGATAELPSGITRCKLCLEGRCKKGEMDKNPYHCRMGCKANSGQIESSKDMARTEAAPWGEKATFQQRGDAEVSGEAGKGGSFHRLNMATVIQETPTYGTPCLNFDVGEELSFLPGKLKERLLPFQKKGIIFAIEKNGR
ncbi:UNVERIFIED_CONTAM: hypothetical protein K2H54_027367 [Gekko kuhli]